MDEDVDNEMHDLDTEFFGNDELEYNSCSVANASNILVPAANIPSSSSGSPSFNCSTHSKKSSATWRWKNTDKPSEKVQCELTANILLRFSSINRLPSIEHYWSTDQCIGNQGLRDVMTETIFKEILHNIYFSDNDTADSNDEGNEVRPLLQTKVLMST